MRILNFEFFFWNELQNFFCLSGAQNVGVNPKVNNMQNAYERAQYPLFLISDAGITSKFEIRYMNYPNGGKYLREEILAFLRLKNYLKSMLGQKF